jgi:hypothetical protein
VTDSKEGKGCTSPKKERNRKVKKREQSNVDENERLSNITQTSAPPQYKGTGT